MNNMDVWDALCRPPTSALKQITAGRLKGKSDISPQWRMQALTEQFGPCGTGWIYSIEKLWTEQGADGEVMAFAHVVLGYKVGDNWSQPIPGIGGSTLVAKEKNGMYNSDEAFKMAVTDAIGVAAKAIGVAADIYMGLFDGSKYTTQPPKRGSISGDLDPVKVEQGKKEIIALVDEDGNGEGTTAQTAMQAQAIWGRLSSDDRVALKDQLTAIPLNGSNYYAAFIQHYKYKPEDVAA